jgi:hypothetical protein
MRHRGHTHVGIGFHSFIDGVIYSIAFTVSIYTGFLATMGMVLLEFPEGGLLKQLKYLSPGKTHTRAEEEHVRQARGTMEVICQAHLIRKKSNNRAI